MTGFPCESNLQLPSSSVISAGWKDPTYSRIQSWSNFSRLDRRVYLHLYSFGLYSKWSMYQKKLKQGIRVKATPPLAWGFSMVFNMLLKAILVRGRIKKNHSLKPSAVPNSKASNSLSFWRKETHFSPPFILVSHRTKKMLKNRSFEGETCRYWHTSLKALIKG